MSFDLYVENPNLHDALTRIRLLARDMPDTDGHNVQNYLSAIKQVKFDAHRNLLNKLSLWQPNTPHMAALPPGAWFIQFIFTLAKPWLSKDDEPFYVSNGVNPVRKDKAFRVPMLAPSSWKGVLRDAARRANKWKEEDAHPELTRLFGNPEGADDDFRAGRLMCYPTFFDRIAVEVINPHSRKTKAGKNPIYLECVPIGTQGVFSLLYTPFDLIGDGEQARQEAKADLDVCAKSISALMLRYGFSAKRTAGFGAANDALQAGFVATAKGKATLTKLAALPAEVSHVEF